MRGSNLATTVAIFLGIAFAQTAFAGTYYVSPTGAASWVDCGSAIPLNGASACSWQTAMASAVAGDTVYFRGGTYEPGEYSGDKNVMNPANSGTADAPIVFQAFPGETALIREATGPGGIGTRSVIGAFRRNFVIWDGLALERNQHDGIGASAIVLIEEAKHITIRNMDIAGRPHKDHTNGSLISVVGKLDSSYIYIYNNKLHGMTADLYPVEPVINASAIWVFDAHHVYISNNDIYDTNNGISWKSQSPNYLYIYDNHFYDCSRTAINVLSQSYVSNTDYHVYRNVFRNCNAAIGGDPNVALLYNLKIYNNTVYTPTNQTFIWLGTDRNHPSVNMEVYNNIYYATSAPAYGSASRGSYYLNLAPNTASFPIYFDNNVYFGPGQWKLNSYHTTEAIYSALGAWQSATGADLHSVVANPFFMNTGGGSPADYKLRSNSPARGAGRNGEDIGAYPYGLNKIGYSAPNLTPAAPMDVRVR